MAMSSVRGGWGNDDINAGMWQGRGSNGAGHEVEGTSGMRGDVGDVGGVGA